MIPEGPTEVINATVPSTTGAPPVNAESNFPNTPQFLFNAAWAASKPPVLLALYVAQVWSPNFVTGSLGPSQAQRWAACAAATAQGYLFDEEIDGLAWDPWTTMNARMQDGDQWVLAGQGTAPIETSDVNVVNVGPMPTNAIKVSVNPADFPAFPVATATTPAPPPPNPAIANPVGGMLVPPAVQYENGTVVPNPNNIGGIFKAYPGDGWAVGLTWNGVIPGYEGTWQKQALEAGMWIAWVKMA